MSVDRIATLIGKELREFRANPSVILPMALMVVVCTIVPFFVVDVLPRLTGESMTSDAAIRRVVTIAQARTPALASLPPESAAAAFLFQQFLLLFLIAPIVGAVSLAAYTVVGEKQGRTLEPLLTTPLSTAELLVAKGIASFLPSMVIEIAGVAVYFALVAALAPPGVTAALFTARSAILLGLLGPFAALAALQATIAVSSRARDPRSAQQIAVLVVLPLVTMLMGQVIGAFFLSSAVLLLVSAGIAGVWVLLILLSVALFERETILTRWR